MYTTTTSVTVNNCGGGPVTVTATASVTRPNTLQYRQEKAFDAINAGTHQTNAIVVNINADADEGATPAVLKKQ